MYPPQSSLAIAADYGQRGPPAETTSALSFGLCRPRVYCYRVGLVPHVSAAVKLLGGSYTQWYVYWQAHYYWDLVANVADQCSNYQYYEIVQGCITITADVLMLLVAIPIIVKVRIPLKQKIILLLVFGMGIFVIIAAILTKVYCLVPALISYAYMNWYFRESTVAMLVTNLPLVWSLFREIFPAIRSWTGSKRTDRYQYPSGPWSSTKATGKQYGRSATVPSNDFSMHDFARTAVVNPGKALSEASYHPSDDRDVISDEGSARALRIRQEFTITVDSEPPSYSSRPQSNYSHYQQV